MAIRISRYGKEIDEIEEYQLSRLADSGQIQPTDLAWKEGAGEWKPLNILFPDLFKEEQPSTPPPHQPSQPLSTPPPPPPPSGDPVNLSADTRPPPMVEVEAPPRVAPRISEDTEDTEKPATEATPSTPNDGSIIEAVEFEHTNELPPNIPAFTTVSVFEHEQIVWFQPEFDAAGLDAILKNKIAKFGDKWPSDLTAEHLSSRGYLLLVPYLICRGEGSARWFAQVGMHKKEAHSDKTTYVTESREGASSLSFTQAIPNWKTGTIDHKLDIDWKKGERIVGSKDSVSNLEIVQPNITSVSSSKKIAKDLLHQHLEKNARSQIIVVAGFITSLSLTNLEVEQLEADPLLYPIVFGSYEYEEKTFFYQIDTVTGALYFGAPLKFSITLTNVGLVLLIVVMIICCYFLIVNM